MDNDYINDLISQMLITIEGEECVKVPITMGEFTIVNINDYNKMLGQSWICVVKGKNKYARAPRGGYLHQLILEPKEGLEIDHKNGNGLDNRKSNLRYATRTLNLANSKKRSNTSSKYKGVHWQSNRGKWGVQIAKDGKTKCLGTYKCEEEAALAYNRAATILFGENARLNEVPSEAYNTTK